MRVQLRPKYKVTNRRYENFGRGGSAPNNTLLIAQKLVMELGEFGCRIHHISNNGSIYIDFYEDAGLGQMRISDHLGINGNYFFPKWNIWIGHEPPEQNRVVCDRGYTHYVYDEHTVDNLINHILNYSRFSARVTVG